MTYIGIDPGVGGGIAAVNGGGELFVTFKMPPTERDVYDALWTLRHDARAALEYVRSSPQMGVTSAFTFGRGYGALRMALLACGIPFEEVTPGKWQRAMGCLTKGDKNISKARAQELFPAFATKLTHATADAALLAEYRRRLEVRA